jgi:hypothetical protein
VDPVQLSTARTKRATAGLGMDAKSVVALADVVVVVVALLLLLLYEDRATSSRAHSEGFNRPRSVWASKFEVMRSRSSSSRTTTLRSSTWWDYL